MSIVAEKQDDGRYEFRRLAQLIMDDRPDPGGNQGLCAGGLSHLERKGFKEYDRVRVTVIIERLGEWDS